MKTEIRRNFALPRHVTPQSQRDAVQSYQLVQKTQAKYFDLNGIGARGGSRTESQIHKSRAFTASHPHYFANRYKQYKAMRSWSEQSMVVKSVHRFPGPRFIFATPRTQE